jgi:hypothetical protein
VTRNTPPTQRGSNTTELLRLLADGPKSRFDLRKAGIEEPGLRKAVQYLRDKGWAFDGVVLTDAGKQAAQELAGWVYEDAPKVPADHIVEQVREWRGVRWG